MLFGKLADVIGGPWSSPVPYKGVLGTVLQDTGLASRSGEFEGRLHRNPHRRLTAPEGGLVHPGSITVLLQDRLCVNAPKSALAR